MLARQYGEWSDAEVNRLSVDTYAAQHPGDPSRKSIHSVAAHLIGLYLTLERGADTDDVTTAVGRAAGRQDLRWLEPPDPVGRVSVLDVLDAEDALDHGRRVRRWARAVWEAWSPHHDTVKEWAGG